MCRFILQIDWAIIFYLKLQAQLGMVLIVSRSPCKERNILCLIVIANVRNNTLL